MCFQLPWPRDSLGQTISRQLRQHLSMSSVELVLRCARDAFGPCLGCFKRPDYSTNL